MQTGAFIRRKEIEIVRHSSQDINSIEHRNEEKKANRISVREFLFFRYVVNMAEAAIDRSKSNLNFLTDCMYFINGNCRSQENCPFRHCLQAAGQLNSCPTWPKRCRNVTCPYRHPKVLQKSTKEKPVVVQALANHPCQPQAPATRQNGKVIFFWDIENVPIPKGQTAFDIVQRIRQKFVLERGLQELDFSCYCNMTTLPEKIQQSLHCATVRMIHVYDRKPGAADLQIMLDLDRFERVHRPPATIILISGDIDFVGKLNALRNHVGFHVIVIHNKPAKEELKATVNEHYAWELFTEAQPPVTNVANGFASSGAERNPRLAEPVRTRHRSTGNARRRHDPSPMARSMPIKQPPMNDNPPIKKYPCPICGHDFDSPQALRQHQIAKDHAVHCPVCDETFVSKESRNQHQKDKKHYELNYKCNQCNRFFSKIESLNQHQQATNHIVAPTPLPTIPAVVRDSEGNDQDPMAVILNGIEVIRQHYIKQLAKK